MSIPKIIGGLKAPYSIEKTESPISSDFFTGEVQKIDLFFTRSLDPIAHGETLEKTKKAMQSIFIPDCLDSKTAGLLMEDLRERILITLKDLPEKALIDLEKSSTESEESPLYLKHIFTVARIEKCIDQAKLLKKECTTLLSKITEELACKGYFQEAATIALMITHLDTKIFILLNITKLIVGETNDLSKLGAFLEFIPEDQDKLLVLQYFTLSLLKEGNLPKIEEMLTIISNPIIKTHLLALTGDQLFKQKQTSKALEFILQIPIDEQRDTALSLASDRLMRSAKIEESLSYISKISSNWRQLSNYYIHIEYLLKQKYNPEAAQKIALLAIETFPYTQDCAQTTVFFHILIRHLTELGCVEKAIDSAKKLPNAEEQNGALLVIIDTLFNQKNITRATSLAMELRDEHAKNKFFKDTLRYLFRIKDFDNIALLASTLPESHQKNMIVEHMERYFLELITTGNLEQIRELSLKIPSEEDRNGIFQSLFETLTQAENFVDAERVIELIDNQELKPRIL
jgi:hypothetical protein